MKPEKILELLGLGEGQGLEFKTTLQSVDSIGKTVCGFLNSGGGYVVCGIADKGDVVGLEISDERLAAFERQLHESISPKTLVSVQRERLRQSTVAVIEVPKGRDVPYSYQNVIYLRKGDKNVVADSPTIRDMVLRTQIEPERWERRFSLADLENDLDSAAVAATVADAEKVKRAFFHDPRDPVHTLEDLSAARHGRLTNGGDVLFARNPAIRLPQTRLRAIRYNSDKAGDTFSDMKSFEGPLYDLFEDAYAFIVRNTASVARFPEDSPKREDSPIYPEAAVREGLINALVHRDYASPSGGVSVHIFPQRLEIWNSGNLPDGVTPESLAKGQISILRNPDISHVLYLRGLMEKAGRGSILIRHTCELQGLPAPTWRSDAATGVTLTFFTPQVTPQATPQVTPQATPQVTPQVGKLLAVLKGEMSRGLLMKRVGIKDRKHFREAFIQPALEQGLVTMTESAATSANQRYRLTELGNAVATAGTGKRHHDKR